MISIGRSMDEAQPEVTCSDDVRMVFLLKMPRPDSQSGKLENAMRRER